MKKHLILTLAAAAALVSCQKEAMVPVDGTDEVTTVRFDLSVKQADETRAVKTGWEAGDVVYVFFTGVEAPKHLKVTFDGTDWTAAEYDGATERPGALGLKEGDTGYMSAVYLPFGNDLTITADGSKFKFDETQYSFYQEDYRRYTVENGVVSGTFQMSMLSVFVHFFIEDPDAVTGGCSLSCNGVSSIGVGGADEEGFLFAAGDTGWGGEMRGYAYQGGYVFSGRVPDAYDFREKDYYFSLTKADGTRYDFLALGKSLPGRSAVKLPSLDNWLPVGTEKWVRLGDYEWATCNEGAAKPEEYGDYLTWQSSNPGKPEYVQMHNLTTQNALWMTVRGVNGYVLYSDASHFIFLPAAGYKEDDPEFIMGDLITVSAGTEGRYLMSDSHYLTFGAAKKPSLSSGNPQSTIIGEAKYFTSRLCRRVESE